MSGSWHHFACSDEYEELRAAPRRFAEKEIAPHAAEADEREELLDELAAGS